MYWSNAAQKLESGWDADNYLKIKHILVST